MMKNIRRFLVTFAMLFVIVLTTACSNIGTNNKATNRKSRSRRYNSKGKEESFKNFCKGNTRL